MSAIFWLLLVVETGTPLHVGNFPDLQSCHDAAASHTFIGPPGTGDPAVFICVQANTGKTGDPEPPH